MRIITKDRLIRERVKNGYTKPVYLFEGGRRENLDQKGDPTLIAVNNSDHASMVMKSNQWEGTEGHYKLWNRIHELVSKVKAQSKVQNAGNNLPTDIYSIIQALTIDLTRRMAGLVDFTSMINDEQTNFAFSKSVNYQEFLPYRGVFKEIYGVNDRAPVIEQHTGSLGSVTMKLYGLEWADTLLNQLFNSIHTAEKIQEAVTRAFVLERNKQSIGKIYDLTFVATQQQAAVSTSGLTYEELLYGTIRKGFELLSGLVDVQTGDYVDTENVALLCHPTNRWNIERVVRGKLEETRATDGRGKLYSPLPISQIWEHRGETFTWNKETIAYTGCATTKAYLLVPKKYSHTLVKRPLTMETAKGEIFTTEKRGYYFCQTSYMDELFGSSVTGTSIGAGKGAIVELTLPTNS